MVTMRGLVGIQYTSSKTMIRGWVNINIVVTLSDLIELDNTLTY